MQEENNICSEFDSLSTETQDELLKMFVNNFKVSKDYSKMFNSRILLEMYISAEITPQISENTIKCIMNKCGFEYKVVDDVRVYKMSVKELARWF